MLALVGDTHGNWSNFQSSINSLAEDTTAIIQLGDFGYWPKFSRYWPPKILLPKSADLYWIDGNHEDFDHLLSFGRFRSKDIVEVRKRIYYIPRGTIVTLGGYNILCIGGADSIDKQYRTPGRDWFPEETVGYQDIEIALDNIEKFEGKIDVVLSHDCPRSFDLHMPLLEMPNPSRDALDAILEEVKPKYWYFAHYHHSLTGFYNGTCWRCLNIRETVYI